MTRATGGSAGTAGTGGGFEVPARAWAAFAVCSTAAFISALDLSITNVAFAEIQRTFPEVSRAGISWVVTAYNIMFGSLLIAGGRIADRVGRKRVFQVGALVFMLGSATCAVAHTLPLLVAGRAIQGIGGAFLTPATLGLLLGAFPASKRTQVVTLWGGIGALGVACGPTLGALLIDTWGWRAAFWINVPICVGAVLVGIKVLTESPRQTGPRPDYPGAVLVTLALAALVLAISEAETWGFDSPWVIGGFVVALVLAPGFVIRSRRHPEPMVDMTLFEHRTFGLANATSLVYGAGFGALTLNNVLFLRTAWGYSVLRAGWLSVVSPVTVALLSGTAGRLATRLGFRKVLMVGTLVAAATQLWFASMLSETHRPWSLWLPAAAMQGVAIALTLPVLGATAVSTLPPDRFALGGAVNNTSRQIGAALGVAVLVAVQRNPETVRESVTAAKRGWAVIAVASVLSTFIVSRLPRGTTPPPGEAPPGERRHLPSAAAFD